MDLDDIFKETNKEKELKIKYHDPYGITSPKNDEADQKLKKF